LRDSRDDHLAGIRVNGRQRLVSLVLALLVEALLVLVVLSLGWPQGEPKRSGTNLVSVDVRAVPDPSPEPEKPEFSRSSPPLQKPRVTPPVPAIAPVEKPAPLAAAIIPVSKAGLASLDIANLPRQPSAAPAPAKPGFGPRDTGMAGDSKRVGSAPGGEPLYAAAWYREPYDDELSGYLSTADGPGWALIACRTVTEFRVEDCVGLDEYPSGSRIQNAVLAAAWQFRVRPPRLGGVSKVGEWVRIRIDYGIRRR
jgi:protein TonB